ncbi:VTT domain-containing protein [Loigolactobacillus coryniformis]|uniref:VTT domain-containing protein n=1 Tax=Loigolactobacillus coryniformis TaxID=1610 RepID=UPI001C5ED403|nr:VTT domain-containing protein [Loigolactobacillus coryniformis]MBW4801900.1 VTT domain-containing protein [Loigolactobacillus coryniformis subsp. torquens]MBW4804614.1 VTT domain-containing protein [Loigolactobacillus coryniformis subsp. torquens]MDC4185845.1 VTT domain-containing protein [Loigolactobacillus coryniformis]
MSILIDFILHIDSHLVTIVNTFGNSTYFILFAIIFIETGAVILPFLPGDSLLFAASALAANPEYHLNIGLFIALFLIACVGGDSSNFWIGHNAERILSRYRWFRRFINEESLAKGQAFFDKHGAMSIILARFMPIIRTFVPFVAAGAGFSYRQFIRYNLITCVAWVALCCGAGYFFGNIPVVKAHFSAIILGIIVISLIPAVVGVLKSRFSAKATD